MDDGAGLDPGRISDDERNPRRAFKRHAFVDQAVLPAHVAVVGREDDDGVLQHPGGAQGVEDLADVVVNALHHAEVARHVFHRAPAAG